MSVRKPNKKQFSLSVRMNDDVFTCQTDDLKEALQSLSPDTFKTKVVIEVANKYSKIERVLMIHRSKALFRNEMVMDIFVKNIMLALKNG